MIETFSYMFVNHSPSSKVPKFMNPKTVMHCAARIIGVPIQKMPGPRGIKKFESVTVILVEHMYFPVAGSRNLPPWPMDFSN